MSVVADPPAASAAVAVPSVDAAPESQAGRLAPPPPARRRRAVRAPSSTWSCARPTRCARSWPGRSPRSRRCAAAQVTILFYEASTRTRVSFEVAAKNLSADVVNIAAASSSVSKGESLVDTVRTVEALGAQMLVMRHSVVRRAVPRRRGLRRLGAQRRRRLARPPDPGAARPVHDARAAARAASPRPGARS